MSEDAAPRLATLPRRLHAHGFPLVRLALGVKAAREREWATADPPFEGWDEAIKRPGVRKWVEEFGGNVGVRSGPAPRMDAVQPGFRYSYWLDLDWGHLSCGTEHDHSEVWARYVELLEFVRTRALLLVLSVSGDTGYGALFAGKEPLSTRDRLLEADGVDLVAFYGVSSTGGGNQKVIPPSRIVPGLLDTPEQRARLRRTEYTVVMDALDDRDRWAGLPAAIVELAGRFGLSSPRYRLASTGRNAALVPRSRDEAEVLRRVGETTLGVAHLAVLEHLRELGHLHAAGHAEVRWALAQVLGQVGAERELALDLLGYPVGSRCRSNRGGKLVDDAIRDPHPFGVERLRKVPLYASLPEGVLAPPKTVALVDSRLIGGYERRPHARARAIVDPDLVANYDRGSA
jgi:hypothetical protein